MKKQYKLGVIGCGYAAQSVLRGVVLSDFLREKKIVAADVSEENLAAVAYLGVKTAGDYRYVAENSEYVLLAVQPRELDGTVKSLGGFVPEKVISVIDCCTKNTVKNALGLSTVKVARCVMNLPCSIGSGAIGVDMSDYNRSYDDTEFISNVFNCLGTVLSIDESKLDAVMSISGCGPAYAFMLIDSLIDAGIKQGLSKSEAKILTVQTLFGSAEMVLNEENNIPDLLMRVCGKGVGLEAVRVLEKNSFRGVISEAVDVCAKRAKELSKI